MKKQQGFTLIELMIVVAIIAILAAIAIPQYQNYVARSQITRAMGEAGQLKTAVEDCFNTGKLTIGLGANECNPGATGSSILTGATQGDPIPANTGVPVIAPTPMVGDADVTITASLGNSASARVAGDTVVWTRDATTGSWTCSTTTEERFAPSGCPVAAGP